MMFCKHSWSMISEHKLPSKLECMRSNGVEFERASEKSLAEFTERKYILVVQCTKCGGLKKVVQRY